MKKQDLYKRIKQHGLKPSFKAECDCMLPKDVKLVYKSTGLNG